MRLAALLITPVKASSRIGSIPFFCDGSLADIAPIWLRYSRAFCFSGSPSSEELSTAFWSCSRRSDSCGASGWLVSRSCWTVPLMSRPAIPC